ncbi:MAG: ATP-grasp domain-containing protein [Patescibacteria group bacterium]|nr:ATP-grasp domain-containing protein [Patescibacteria group bacterium]
MELLYIGAGLRAKAIKNRLQSMAFPEKPVVYVSREIERALGSAPSSNYRIVSGKTLYGESVSADHPGCVTLIDEKSARDGGILGTTELLQHPSTRSLMDELGPEASILVFKNTVRVETAAKALGRRLLNPPASLSERVENKLSQLRWLGPLGAKYLPPHAAKLAKYITWKSDEPFVVQWAHGHTGDGTSLVRAPDDLRAIQDRFPERMARVTAFVDGPSFTANAVVTKDRVLVANPSYQITGLPPFTDSSFTTIGNDWGLAARLLSPDDASAIRGMAKEIGAKLQADGWKGLFGIDLIKDESRGRFYLIEVNARQPASTTFESNLQDAARKSRGAKGLTTFEAHLRALLDLPIDQDLVEIADGAQIIQRVTKNVESIFDDAAKSLEKSGFGTLAYQNTAMNSDLLRVQSDTSIMSDHKAFNSRGTEIAEAIKRSHLNLKI